MVNALTPIPKVPSFEQNDDETALIGSGEFYLRTTTIFQGQNPKQLATPSSNPPLHTQWVSGSASSLSLSRTTQTSSAELDSDM